MCLLHGRDDICHISSAIDVSCQFSLWDDSASAICHMLRMFFCGAVASNNGWCRLLKISDELEDDRGLTDTGLSSEEIDTSCVDA